MCDFFVFYRMGIKKGKLGHELYFEFLHFVVCSFQLCLLIFYKPRNTKITTIKIYLFPVSRESDTCRTILEKKRESDDVITCLDFRIKVPKLEF